MKLTLLDLTQTILSRMDSDEINSINDTVESQQVAKTLRSVYFDIVNRANVPSQYTLFQLEASNDSSKPILMTIPDEIQTISWLQYDRAEVTDTTRHMTDLISMPLDTFIREMNSINTDETDVDTFEHILGTSTIVFNYRTDVSPRMYTSFDDTTLVFDSYDSSVDSTLQKSKTLGWGKKNIPWTMTDLFIPDLDDKEFPLLLNEATSQCFVESKQTPNPIADRNARRNWVNIQKSKTKIPLSTDLMNLPNFGR